MTNYKSKVLGRGLSAILNNNNREISEIILELGIHTIKMNPEQPRKYFDIKKLEELKNSILQNGIIQPITVKKIHPDEYIIISGERRFRAAKSAGLSKIPAYIKNIEEERLLELALVENLQRDNLNIVEIANGYKKLMEEHQYTQEDVAKKIGKNRTTVTNFLRLLKLPDEILLALKEEKITMGHAKAILNIEDSVTQNFLFKKIINEQLSVRKIEELVKRLKNDENFVRQTEKKVNDDFVNYIKMKREQLQQKLNRKINIKSINKEKGELKIQFNSKKELDELIAYFE